MARRSARRLQQHSSTTNTLSTSQITPEPSTATADLPTNTTSTSQTGYDYPLPTESASTSSDFNATITSSAASSSTALGFNATSTTSSAATSTSTEPSCLYTAPVVNAGFERHGGNTTPPWTTFANSSDVTFSNEGNTTDSPSYKGRRHVRVTTTADYAVLTITQSLTLCPNFPYEFSAWSRILRVESRCTVVIHIGGFPVAFRSSLTTSPDYEEIVGVFGPWDATAVDLIITVTCTSAGDVAGATTIDLDEVRLTPYYG
ncbi:MAG: hypothetical protein M1826_006207 [Phylliscum demangeonii]|nr:MAG: hypothetical protein M1826_006207 [Phylliscum demangeonii]